MSANITVTHVARSRPAADALLVIPARPLGVVRVKQRERKGAPVPPPGR